MFSKKSKSTSGGLKEPLLNKDDFDLTNLERRETKTEAKSADPKAFWSAVYSDIEANSRHEVQAIISEAFTRATRLPRDSFHETEIPFAHLKDTLLTACQESVNKMVGSTQFKHNVVDNQKDTLKNVILMRLIYELESITKPQIHKDTAEKLSTELKQINGIQSNNKFLELLHKNEGRIEKTIDDFDRSEQLEAKHRGMT